VATDLDRLLESIDPRAVRDRVAARVDDAVNSFPWRRASIGRWDDFQRCLAEFHSHIASAALHSAFRADSLDFDWGRCVHLLRGAFGGEGEKAAFEMGRTGAEGGLLRVLRTIAEGLVEDFSENEVSARIVQWWQSRSSDELLQAADEYIEKWGHLLPSELTEGSAARLRVNFLQVLREHPRLLRRVRRVGG
jgi:hypothetical protein